MSQIDMHYLRSLREKAKAAVANEDKDLAFEVIKEIRANDLLIAAPPPPMEYVKTITVQHATVCLKCGTSIPVGMDAYWKPRTGSWHLLCEA